MEAVRIAKTLEKWIIGDKPCISIRVLYIEAKGKSSRKGGFLESKKLMEMLETSQEMVTQN